MSRSPARPARKGNRPLWQESILLVAAALVIAVVVKAFFLQAFYIPSGSMEPTMLVNDKILVEKVSYWFGDVQRGDIVVFDDSAKWLGEDDPADQANLAATCAETIGLYPSSGHLIKRVIGVGGDTVKCCTDGQLTVNGDHDRRAVPARRVGRPPTARSTVKVRKNHLWVMGDNRGNSSDSRAHRDDREGGQVPVDQVVGKAWLRVWPLDRFGFIHGTSAFDDVPAP